MKSKEKPKYSLLQNIAYAFRLAWKHSRLLLVLPGVSALMGIVIRIVQLYIAPVILQKVGQAVPLGELLGTIALFTLALLAGQCAKAYVDDVQYIGKIRLQDALSIAAMRHGCTTSYPNQLNPAFRGKQNGADASINSNANHSIYSVFTQVAALGGAVVGFGLYLLILRGLDGLLVAVVIATTLLGYFAQKQANEWAYAHREESVKIRLRRNYIINLAMTNEMQKDIRIFGMRQWLDEVYSGMANLWQAFCRRREKRYLWAKLTDVALSFARNAIAYAYLIHMAIAGQISVTRFLLYFSAIAGFTGWVATILSSIADLHKVSLQICQLREYLEWPEPFRFENGQPVPEAPPQGYELKLEDVSFRYPGAGKDTISHINLTIRPGEKLAIVGLNGAGKTTLIKLLCGLLDPTGGRVCLNGIDIRRFNRREYYALFTAVFQDFSILEATVGQNVAQRLSNIDEERLQRCAEQAGLAKVAGRLPKGLDTMLGKTISDDGVHLSGGETQRLMLARALYKDAPILMLDEPTAALDPIAENEIYCRYREMTRGRTSVYISHRLASTRFCDRILYLQDGNILEEGTHDALMALGGKYCELFRVQSRYYQEGASGDEA